MRKLFSSRRRFIALGLMSAFVIALAVLGALWGFGQRASASPDGVTLMHVNPDGSDYTGNPYCPDTDWSLGKNHPIVNPAHDCNNITGEDHIIRTEGLPEGADSDEDVGVGGWVLDGVGQVLEYGYCDELPEVYNLPNWDTANDEEYCAIIRSTTPGETVVTFSYGLEGDYYITPGVVKEWDSLVDSVILKYGDLEKVKVYYDKNGDGIVGTSEYVEVYLPLDVNNDGVRDQLDEHQLDKQGEWQEHPVVFDESLKRIKSSPPVQIIEVVHGEHEVLVNNHYVTVHQPTEGAIVTATIESPRNCTFFTDALGTLNLGRTVTGVSDNLGRLTVYVDTVCEEQAQVKFHVTYPPAVGSLRLPLDEWVGINWTTIELAKQPQIRWAGEEIILAKRWALPDEYYPNLISGTSTPQLPCPLATIGGAVYSDEDNDTGDPALMDTVVTHHVNYTLDSPGLGTLKGAYVDIDGDGVLDSLVSSGASEASGTIDDQCISKGLADSEDPGEQNIEALLMEDTFYCPALAGIDITAAAAGTQLVAYGEISYDPTVGTWVCSYTDYLGPYSYYASLQSSVLINKHAFLVWYLKIYQVKLTNVDGARANHNDGTWAFGKGADTEAETLNVSKDTLLRVIVKGWFFSADKSGRGAVCIDMNGNGNGKTGDDATEPGVPYPVTNEDVGCPDAGDQMLENGHWVLPDDLPLLAGADAIHTRPNWDVMSEATAAKTTAIGPKNALDSHDSVLRAWVGRKSVVPDGAISAADAIMPPLKIRASIASGDAGFLKEALKDIVYPTTNDYHSSLFPADKEIPAIVNNGGYDWMSWTMPSCSDVDQDGVCDAVDLCPTDFDPTNGDLDADGIGDVCDPDADGDGILDDGDDSGVIGDNPCINGDLTLCDDNCEFTVNADQADADSDGIGTLCDTDDTVAGTVATDLDSDGDTVLDLAPDNCPTKSNADQADTDGDGYGNVCDWNASVPYDETAPIPYPFWTILNKLEREDTSETNPALTKRPYYIEFYTDNRGEGMFFANGDFMLSYDDCRTDPVSGAPDCSNAKPDVVGKSTITVIGDYPYFRKHSSVLSNPVVKTWTWGGFKDVESVRIDANHTAIIAHLLDRDGFCKYSVGSNPTLTNAVTFSPSLHPVQGEEIEFILNTDVGAIIAVSPDGVYNAAHTPLGTAAVVRLEDGTIIDRSEAVALAEDGRVLDYFDEARGIDEGLVAKEDCQAWIVVEHPLGEEPNVSIRLHDPEGLILRHYPQAEVTVQLVQNWNDSCYVGPEATIEDAMSAIIDNVKAVYRYDADDQSFDQYFPGRCAEAEGLCTIDTIKPYDQLFILMAAPAQWVVGPIAAGAPADNMDAQIDLVGATAASNVPAAWNSICYAGADKPTEEATRGIESGLAIMYQLGSDQMWRRYVPDRPEIPDTLTTLHRYDSVVLLVTSEGGITWVFDP